MSLTDVVEDVVGDLAKVAVDEVVDAIRGDAGTDASQYSSRELSVDVNLALHVLRDNGLSIELLTELYSELLAAGE